VCYMYIKKKHEEKNEEERQDRFTYLNLAAREQKNFEFRYFWLAFQRSF